MALKVLLKEAKMILQILYSHYGHYIEVAQIYETENVIWIGFGLIGNTEKKSLGQLYATFKDVFFMFWDAKTKL